MDRKIKRRAWVLAGFLIMMIICTILSRAAASVLVAQVQVEKLGRGKLSYSYGGNGTVVPEQEKTIFLWAGQQVEWAAETGSAVKAGECLIQFRMEYLQQTIRSKQAELAQLEIQVRQQEIAARGTVRVSSAERALQNLEDAQKKLEDAQEKEMKAREEYDQFDGSGVAGVSSGRFGESAGQSGGVIGGRNPETSEEMPGIQDPDNSEEDPGNVLPDNSSDISSRQQELKAALEQAQADVEAARQAADQARTEYQFALKEDSAQNTNEANSIQSAQLGVQSLHVQADKARRELEELTAYQNAGGRICAEEDCTVLMSGVQTGTFTTGAEVMVTGIGGWKLKGFADAKDKEKLKAGTEAEIRLGAGKKRTVRMESVSAERSEGSEGGAGGSGSDSGSLQFCWYARLPENTAAENGNTFTWNVNAASDQEYEQIIPLSALREDTAGAFCLILLEEKNMLGTVQTAKRIPVTVLEKDAQKAAVTSTLKESDQIIASSEKYVEEGERVRIKE
ncbi:hypothetical protein [Schaedlerella sp.]|uniref:hypothetical protein n=1 Tax=Schaedlerella sp. TaxID=2676057 RepID=UPI003746ADE7